MAKYEFSWEELAQRNVEIEAETIEEAYEKWSLGEYPTPSVDDQTVYGEIVEIDGKSYDNCEFKKAD